MKQGLIELRRKTEEKVHRCAPNSPAERSATGKGEERNQLAKGRAVHARLADGELWSPSGPAGTPDHPGLRKTS